MLRTLAALAAATAAALALATHATAAYGPAPAPAPVLAPVPATLYSPLPTRWLDLQWSPSDFDPTAYFPHYAVMVKTWPTGDTWAQQHATWDSYAVPITTATYRLAVRTGSTYQVAVVAEQTFFCLIWSCVWERAGGQIHTFAVEPVTPPPPPKKG
jgi:hypothetical protein